MITEEMIAKAHTDFIGFRDTSPEVIPCPTRMFNIGDECQVGNLDDCVVAEVLHEGKAYRIDCASVSKNQYTREVFKTPKTGIWWWFDVEPRADFDRDADELFAKHLPGQIQTSSIDSLLHLMGASGLVCDPRYQRGYVWSLENQENLIDSIFNRMNIGALIFSRHAGYLHRGQSEFVTYTTLDGRDVTIPRENDYTCAVIDGQQRATTLWRFITGQFSYKGRFWKDLNPADQGQFLTSLISYRLFDEDSVPYEDVLRMFIKTNRGVPQDENHLDAVKKQLEELENE